MPSNSASVESNNQTPSEKLPSLEQEIKCESKYYKNGDFVDIIDVEYGSWIEAVITDIFKSINNDVKDDSVESDLTFKVNIER